MVSDKDSHLLSAVFALLLLGNISDFLLEMPIVRLIERRVSLEYYISHLISSFARSGGTDESLCKRAPIQNMLATITC